MSSTFRRRKPKIAENGVAKHSSPRNGRPEYKRSRSSSIRAIKGMTAWVLLNQKAISSLLLATILICHYSSIFRSYTELCLHVSHYDAKRRLYSKGWSDIYFVLFWTIAFVGLRATVMDYVLHPFARRAGISSQRNSSRFAEQGWSLTYYVVFWSLGMYICVNSPYFGNIRALWMDYPQTHVTGVFKWYYLVQFGFWLSQIVVLNIEARRRDYHQMLCHHIVTCTLILMSYMYNVTRVGNMILCLMDFCDIVLPAAKMLKYLGFEKICDIAFSIFMISWVITRHVLYGKIIYSAAFDAKDLMGGYRWKPEQGILFTRHVHVAFLCLLSALQIILCAWFYLIVCVALRVVRGQGAEDNRSEDEDEDEDENEDSEDRLGHNADGSLLGRDSGEKQQPSIDSVAIEGS